MDSVVFLSVMDIVGAANLRRNWLYGRRTVVKRFHIILLSLILAVVRDAQAHSRIQQFPAPAGIPANFLTRLWRT